MLSVGGGNRSLQARDENARKAREKQEQNRRNVLTGLDDVEDDNLIGREDVSDLGYWKILLRYTW